MTQGRVQHQDLAGMNDMADASRNMYSYLLCIEVRCNPFIPPVTTTLDSNAHPPNIAQAMLSKKAAI